MNIFVISSDSFFTQEMITHLHSESRTIEIHENGLNVLSDIRERIPDVVIIDNDCDGINPLVLNKILCRDGRFDKTVFHFIIPKKIEDEDSFNKTNNITNLWIKPVNFQKIAASIN